MGVGDFLLSFAILLAGASASKVFRVLSHMGVACHSLRQFFMHQKVSNIDIFQCYSYDPIKNLGNKLNITARNLG